MPAQLAPLLHCDEDVATQISGQSVKWADHIWPLLFLLEQRREEWPTPEVIHVPQDALETQLPKCLHRFAPRHFAALMLSLLSGSPGSCKEKFEMYLLLHVVEGGNTLIIILFIF